MKIICLQENLKNNLNIVQNIIGKNLTLPILNNLLLESDNGRLRISSTNLEIGINTWTSGKIEREGAITCPAKILFNFVNNLPNKKIELEAKNNILTVKCENYKASIKGLSADDFPIIPKIKNDPIFEINNLCLKEALMKVSGCAAVSESRPEISGVFFSLNKEGLKLAATDSFRLAEKTEKMEKIKQDHSMILPQRTAQELIRILGEKEGVMKVILGSNQVLFESGEIQIISRLIDGQYPDYRQIVPQNFITQTLLNKEEFLNAVRIAGFFSSKVNNVKFSIQAGKMEILSQDPDLGENKTQIQAEVKGKEMEIEFNYRYLLDGLNNISAKQIFMGFSSESTAAVIKSAENDDYLYVVMPIKIS